MSILVSDHYCIILWICLLPLSVCLTEVMHSRFIWIYYIIVYWQSLCVIGFILLSVYIYIYISGQSRVISSDVADENYWSVSSWTSKIYIWKSLELLNEHYRRSLSLDEQYHHSSTKFIKNNQKILYFWRFDLYQRPSSEEAGTRSSSSGSTKWNFSQYHHSLTEVIARYHRAINKIYIWRIFNVIGQTSWYIWRSWLMNVTIWMNNVPEYLNSS